MANHKEEISDIIPDKLWENPDFKPGFILRFDQATLRVTKINRKAKRVWAEHAQLVEQIVANTHVDHLLDSTQEAIEEFGVPFCQDCMIPIDEGATKEGKKLAADRADGTLADGTVI